MSRNRLSVFLAFWRRRSIPHKLELVALVFLWLMIIIVAANFDYFPVVEIDGQYFAKEHGFISLEQAWPYLFMEYAFWAAAGFYVLARLGRWIALRRERNSFSADGHDA